MQKKNRGILRVVVVTVVVLAAILCMFAQPALAAGKTQKADPANCKHTYTSWEVVKEHDDLFALGQKERECTKCGQGQYYITMSPLLLVITVMLALIILVMLSGFLTKLADGFRKGYKKFLWGLLAALLLVLLVGAVAQTVMGSGTFIQNLTTGVVQLLGGKGFYAKSARDCLYMMFGEVACRVINTLFYVAFVALIIGIFSLIRSTIRSAKKLGEDTAKKAKEVKEKLLG